MSITSTLKPPIDVRERLQDTRTTGMAPLKPATITVEDSTKTAPVEGTKAPSPTEPEKKPSELDPRMEQLARRERAIRNQARQLDQQKKDWEAQQKAASAPKALTAEDFKKQFLQDPTSVGLTWDDLANVVTNAPTPETQQFSVLNAKIAELEAKLAGTEQNIQTAQQKARQDALTQISREVESIVNNDESLEMIRSDKENIKAVTDLIELTYDEESYVMDYADAVKQVEDYLTEKALATASLKKVQSKLNPPTEQPQTQQQQKSQTSTLTRATTPASTQTLTPKDRKARAIAAFQGKL